MFRALIVEDIETTCAQLKLFLQESFQNPNDRSAISIDTAATVSEGRRLIEKAFDDGNAYDAVILDSNLPKEWGSTPEVDESLCLCVRQLTPTTLVAHITAYSNDQEVHNHLTRVHLEQLNVGVVLSKIDINYPTKLVKILKSFLYGLQLEGLRSALFQDEGAPARALRGRTPSGRSLTHELASLRRLITSHWYDFDDTLRAKLKQVFTILEVEDDSNPVRVCLRPRTRLRDADRFSANPSDAPFPNLPLSYDSTHFVLHYGLRNPYEGHGLGADGVRNHGLIHVYARALERLYQTMTEPPWNRPPPVDGKTHVFVLDAPAHADVDETNTPFIILPSRSDETSEQAELLRATAEAVHEATHIFSFTQRPFNDVASVAWEWFDEGFAVFMEMNVTAGNLDYFRFLTDWINKPEQPLDDPRGKYQAGMFIRYVSILMGSDFVNKVWTLSARWETPLETLSRLMPAGRKAFSPDPKEIDLFGSGYCLDFYFMWNQENANIAPEVFLRFGERAVSASLVLSAGQETGVNGTLDHLACRYYRINIRGGATKLEVRFYVGDPTTPTTLKAQVAVVTRERQRAKVILLCEGEHAGMLSAELGGLDAYGLDHMVLVVSNCGVKSLQNSTDGEHDDGKAFYFTISAS